MAVSAGRRVSSEQHNERAQHAVSHRTRLLQPRWLLLKPERDKRQRNH
jgi:hypothetical protein